MTRVYKQLIVDTELASLIEQDAKDLGISESKLMSLIVKKYYIESGKLAFSMAPNGGLYKDGLSLEDKKERKVDKNKEYDEVERRERVQDFKEQHKDQPVYCKFCNDYHPIDDFYIFCNKKGYVSKKCKQQDLFYRTNEKNKLEETLLENI